MHLARSVLESARRNHTTFDSIRQEDRAQGSSPSTMSGTQQFQNSYAALPSYETALNLIEIFFAQHQVQYPILTEDQFMAEVSNFYARNSEKSLLYEDVRTRFMLNIVFTVSLVHLSHENPEALTLAQSFNANAMADLSSIMPSKDIRTVQCLLLLLLSCLLNTSSAPIWYISGLCMRMCIDLGFHSERTIEISGAGPDENDLKRRLFWVTYGFDRSLSTMLGRPFTIDDSKIDVKLPDRSLSEKTRSQVLHWIKLQKILSSIVSRSPSTRNEDSRGSIVHNSSIEIWTTDMARELALWHEQAANLSDPVNYSLDWWKYWYQNALLVLHRPASKSPSLGNQESWSTCYAASKTTIQLTFIRANKGMGDSSWVDVHYQLMSGIIMLFIVWNRPEVRQMAKSEWTTFKSCLVQWETVLERLASRWERLARAREVLVKLCDATVDVVEKEMGNLSHRRREKRPRFPTKERDRRRSIMQDLASPGLHPRDRTQALNDRPVIFQQKISPKFPEMFSDSSLPQEQLLNTQTIMDPQNAQAFPIGSSDLAQSVSPPSWSQQGNNQWPSGSAEFQFPSEISTMVGDDIWADFGSYDTSAMPMNLGFFEYFPIPMSSVEDPNRSGVGNTGRIDTALTESVLNFRGAWDDVENDVQ